MKVDNITVKWILVAYYTVLTDLVTVLYICSCSHQTKMLSLVRNRQSLSSH